METNLGMVGRLKEAGEGASELVKVLGAAPAVLAQAERMALALADMAQQGVRLDDATITRLAAAQARRNRWSTLAIWIGALSLALLAARQLGLV